jgi:hypothetical protein
MTNFRQRQDDIAQAVKSLERAVEDCRSIQPQAREQKLATDHALTALLLMKDGLVKEEQ